MRTIRMDRKRSAGTVAAALAIVAARRHGSGRTRRRPDRHAHPDRHLDTTAAPGAPRPRRRPRRLDDHGTTTSTTTTTTPRRPPRPRRPPSPTTTTPTPSVPATTTPRAPRSSAAPRRSRSRTCRSGSSSSAASPTPSPASTVRRRPVGPRLPTGQGLPQTRRRRPAHLGPPPRAHQHPDRGRPHARRRPRSVRSSSGCGPWAVWPYAITGVYWSDLDQRGPRLPAVTQPAAVGRHRPAHVGPSRRRDLPTGHLRRLPLQRRAATGPADPRVPRRPLPHGPRHVRRQGAPAP